MSKSLIFVASVFVFGSAWADTTSDLAAIQQDYGIQQTQRSTAFLLQQQQAAIELQTRQIRALSKQIEELKQGYPTQTAYRLPAPVNQARQEYNPNTSPEPSYTGDTTLLQGTNPVPTPTVEVTPTYYNSEGLRRPMYIQANYKPVVYPQQTQVRFVPVAYPVAYRPQY